MENQVWNVYRKDEANVGDIHSSPLKYFNMGGAKEIDIEELAGVSDQNLSRPVVIFGGGGLLGFSRKWDKQIHRVIALNPRAIIWGAGVNKHLRPATMKELLTLPYNRARKVIRVLGGTNAQADWWPEYVLGARLVGLRDDGAGPQAEWVPCASCMRPEFDLKVRVVRKVGVFQHQGVPIRLQAITPDDVLDNKHSSIEEVLHFLASSGAVITSSYHGAYWSVLLNKPTIVYRPFSTKFERMRHKPVVYSGNLQQDLQDAEMYSHALEECREANIDFSLKVRSVVADA